MKYLFTVFLLLIFATACKPKIISGPELEKKLIKTMQDHLDKTAQPGVVYKVEDIAFFPEKEKKLYICEFHVNMKVAKNKIDTTGIMTADIPNDFSKVIRKQ